MFVKGEFGSDYEDCDDNPDYILALNKNPETGIHPNFGRPPENLQAQIRQHLPELPEAVLGEMISPLSLPEKRQGESKFRYYLSGIISI